MLVHDVLLNKSGCLEELITTFASELPFVFLLDEGLNEL